MVPVHQEVVIGLPKKHADRVFAANAILAALNNNNNFPNAGAQVTAAQAAVKTYAQAVTDAKNKVHGASTVRGEAYVAMVKAFDPLIAIVQAQVDAHLDQAATLAESAKMKLRKKPARTKPDFAVYDGKVSGQVHLVVRAIAGALLYYWEISSDQKTFSVSLDTSSANAFISSLTPGQTYYFRFRVRTRKGMGDYSQIITHIAR
jgi:hypothetical protein